MKRTTLTPEQMAILQLEGKRAIRGLMNLNSQWVARFSASVAKGIVTKNNWSSVSLVEAVEVVYNSIISGKK